MMLVTSPSCRSVRKPVTTDSSPGAASHIGSRPSTTGMKRWLYAGGGEVVAHSSVGAFHGLSPAGAPTLRLLNTFTTNTTPLATMKTAPKLANAFKPPHPISGRYV